METRIITITYQFYVDYKIDEGDMWETWDTKEVSYNYKLEIDEKVVQEFISDTNFEGTLEEARDSDEIEEWAEEYFRDIAEDESRK